MNTVPIEDLIVIHICLKKITRENKEDLELVMFPQIKITYDELFDLGDI